MLITSISGIRGTLGDVVGQDLTETDVRNFACAYGSWVVDLHQNPTIIIGRDARESGADIAGYVIESLTSLGIKVIDLGLATTPTVEMMVIQFKAQGAIIVTASHNPKEYNGLKMLDEYGEFLSGEQGQAVLDRSKEGNFDFQEGGSVESYNQHHEDHIQAICALDLVDTDLVASKGYTVVLDGINSVGGLAAPMLLETLGVSVVPLHCEPHGDFAHNPEPLEKNLSELMQKVVSEGADLGIAVDPDSDRLVFVDEQGKMFGEEYTLVAIADYVLSQTRGSTVSNLSSSRALRDIADRYDVSYFASKVGEKNVVEMMKEQNAVIGGEGSGGVIYPPLHHGRDALVGIGLFLSSLAQKDILVSELRSSYPDYFMAKEKVVLEGIDPDDILHQLKERYASEEISTIDGLKIDFEDSWVHMRKSNTEPILRIYTEAGTQASADALAERFIHEIQSL